MASVSPREGGASKAQGGKEQQQAHDRLIAETKDLARQLDKLRSAE
ncbi:hypothetical protein ACFWJW_00465 [Streptomyces sp. NPDC127097]